MYPLSAHQHTPTQGHREGKGGRGRERVCKGEKKRERIRERKRESKRPPICWSGTPQILLAISETQAETRWARSNKIPAAQHCSCDADVKTCPQTFSVLKRFHRRQRKGSSKSQLSGQWTDSSFFKWNYFLHLPIWCHTKFKIFFKQRFKTKQPTTAFNLGLQKIITSINHFLTFYALWLIDSWFEYWSVESAASSASHQTF